jgi:isoleucyl-tRNA synthetase
MHRAASTSIPKRGRRQAPPAFEGMKVWAANPIIIAMLEERPALLAACSRSGPLLSALLALPPSGHLPRHGAVVHRPRYACQARRWLKDNFRQLAIEEIDKVVWDPAWGKERITNMIATRPDWCISRQRIWGVPIAVFLCENCQTSPSSMLRSTARSWTCSSAKAPRPGTRLDVAKHLLPENRVCKSCAQCGGNAFRKETDILDVWFDSGTSWFAVAEIRSRPQGCLHRLFKQREGRARASTLKAATSTAAGSTRPC